MIQYENIEFLNLLFLIPVIIITIIINEKWRNNKIELFGERELIAKLTSSFSKRKYNIKKVLSVLIMILIIIGLSNPKIGTKMEEVKRKGVDLMIAIDLSNSMLAEDIKPNRLDRSKQAISRLIDKLEGDRIGIIVFAGEAYVQLPITTDYSAAKLFLSSINTEMIATQGTEISKAIELSNQSFDMNNNQNKAIIIITDGENHDEKAIASAKKSQEQGVLIHTLGMGLTKGGPIPIYNGTQVSFRKDKKGNTIISKLNEDLLRQIAEAGKGTYVRANNSKSGLTTLFKEINKMEKKEIGTMVVSEYKDQFQFFIGLALLLLIVDLLMLNKKINITKLY